MNRWKVMVADDEEYLLTAMQKLIDWDAMGCELAYCARNGRELLDMIEKEQPDIVITDIKMPVMGGMEVAKYVYENLNRTLVILLTGFADFEYAKEAIHYDVSDYIIKTAMLDQLPESIQKATQKLESLRAEKVIPDEEWQSDDIMARLQRYIEANFTKKLTLLDIAGAVHANRSYISRLYKQKTGVNLFDAINRLKIEKSKEMLLSGLKVYEVAEKVGFDDVAYFSKVFKKIEGCSPKDFSKDR